MIVRLIGKTDKFQYIRYTLFDGIVSLADAAHRKSDVLIDRHLGDQAEILEHDTHRAPQIRHLAARELLEVHIIDDDRAGCRHLLAHDQLEEGTFTGAGRADDKDELSLLDVQGYIVQRVNAVTVIYLGNIVKLYHSNTFR